MSDTTILQNSTHVIKPKKSVALSGVPAGNTALCTVGKSGNDLHYRGYDILRSGNSTMALRLPRSRYSAGW